MIESHINPERALSDAAQQVTPESLGTLLLALDDAAPSWAQEDQLGELRRGIDHLDDVILKALASRMDIVEEVARVKRALGAQALQEGHVGKKSWGRGRSSEGSTWVFGEKYILDLYGHIHRESVKRQEDILEEASSGALEGGWGQEEGHILGSRCHGGGQFLPAHPLVR